MMIHHRTSLLAALLFATGLFSSTSTVHGQTDISWYTIDGGGITFATDGGTLEVGGTIGQPDLGDMTDGTINIHGGFWFDVGSPMLNTPTDIAIFCGDSPDPLNTGLATGSDDCDGNAVINYSDVSSGSHPTVITRTWTLTDDCGNSLSDDQIITVNDIAPPTSPIATPTSFCNGGSSTLTATVPGAETVDWFTDSCGGTAVPGGASPTVMPSVTTIYYAQARNPDTGCVSFDCSQATVTVYDSPVMPDSASVDSPSYCSGGAPATITLTATGGMGGTLAWYSDSCGGTFVGSGSPLIISAPAATTNYYVRWETTSCGSSDCANVTVTVNASPIAPTSASVDSPMYCSDSVPGTITLTATGGSGDTLVWYSGSCGSTSVDSGNPLTISAPVATTNYFARWETTSCGNSACAMVSVTVNNLPATPVNVAEAPNPICVGQSGTLSADVAPGETVDWYTGSCAGMLVGSGSPFGITGAATTIYYARARNTTTGCASASCGSILVNVSPTPMAPNSATASPSIFCAGSVATIDLSASGGSGANLRWFDDFCGGNSIGTGSPLTISAPSASTTYFARWENSCGVSGCASVFVTVNALPAQPTNASADPQVICAGGSSTLSATVGSGETVDWFTLGCGGTPVSGGSSPTVMPGATTTYYARARNTTSGCVSAICATATVTISTTQNLVVDVQLGGGVMAPGTLKRCIKFELWNCSIDPLNPVYVTSEQLTFTNGLVNGAVITIPCGTYECVTARDRLHTLRRTVTPVIIPGGYSASFTGAKALVGGNLNDDKFIDILDFGIYSTQDLTVAPGGKDTICSQNPPFRHSDINGDGIIDGFDYSFIAVNFLKSRDANCCTAPGLIGAPDEGPIDSISIEDLNLRGLGNLAAADLNHDGVVNQDDVRLYLQSMPDDVQAASSAPSVPEN